MNNPAAYLDSATGAVVPLFWASAALLALCILFWAAWSTKK